MPDSPTPPTSPPPSGTPAPTNDASTPGAPAPRVAPASSSLSAPDPVDESPSAPVDDAHDGDPNRDANHDPNHDPNHDHDGDQGGDHEDGDGGVPDPSADAPEDSPAVAAADSRAAPASAAAALPEPVSPPSGIRCFIAVNLPVAVVRRIAEDATALRATVAATPLKVAWVPPANLHVTLKFLGMIRPESVEAIRGLLTRELAARASFDLEARGMGAFPSASSPRVLWAGLRDQPALVALQQEVERHLEALGFAREERAFHAHLTLGRVKSGSAPLEAAFAERAERSYGIGRVTEVVIYESRTDGRGAEYRALARVPLGRAVPR